MPPVASLVSVTIYIVDIDDYKAHAREIGVAWKRSVGAEYPAMAGIGVNRLWDASRRPGPRLRWKIRWSPLAQDGQRLLGQFGGVTAVDGAAMTINDLVLGPFDGFIE